MEDMLNIGINIATRVIPITKPIKISINGSIIVEKRFI